VNGACSDVTGAGSDSCTSNSDCTSPPVCGNGKIESPEKCEKDGDCTTGKICVSCQCVNKPTYCGNGVVDNNEECDGTSGVCENGKCGSNCKCIYPPVLNCEEECALLGMSIVLGHGFTTGDECANAAKEAATTCYTTCIKSGFIRGDNIAGWDSCCCKKKQMFACTDCPGQHPYCQQCPSEYQ
jgi:hypothetical protein